MTDDQKSEVMQTALTGAAMDSSFRTDKINMSAIGAAMRYEKIENALSVAIAIREQRQQNQEAAYSASATTMQTALLKRLEGKLLANKMGLTELRKMVDDAWKGETVSCSEEGDNSTLQKLGTVILMKEDECYKARKIIAEIRGNTKKRSVVRRIPATCA
jgi:hypothetical protein